MKQYVMLVAILAGLLVGGGALPALATIILQDGFVGTAGSAVDSTKWDPANPDTAVPQTELDGASNVHINGPYDGTSGIKALSSYAYMPVGPEFARLTIGSYTNLNGGSGHRIMGLNSVSGAESLDIRTDVTGTTWVFESSNSGGANFARWDLGIAEDPADGEWVIEWKVGGTGAFVYRNGILLLDTGVTAPTFLGGTATGFLNPGVGLVPFLFTYGGADFDVGSITWESAVAPEPASVALLAFGGLVCWRHRSKRRA